MSVIISVVPFVIAAVVSSTSASMALGEVLQEEAPHLTLPTIIRQEALLKKTLLNLGASNIREASNQVQSHIDQFHIVFEKDNTGLFHIKFIGDIGQQEAADFVQELQEEYGRVVQEYVYTQLKQKAEEKGLTLEQEAVQRDQSIVLTFNLNS
ncbi:hypothetical protein [Chitinophaga nivalis]|uniref:DUF1257 domain-containing protein n=1 Tax=Chitinophaga nivalis TaxID=2991709 RepID=A0ABT3IQP9_9BACT|nr:hypothetical protein [Chitinophaga nivalis]MCW3463999.1 hypothetical protein [Chitinophaga nivalis]MCW3486311.1 hypothetical protein [Chitinophaga nivalis]